MKINVQDTVYRINVQSDPSQSHSEEDLLEKEDYKEKIIGSRIIDWQRDAYDCWTKANDKTRVYILASLSDVLNKKHEAMMNARQIMESLQKMFGQPFS